MVEAASLLHLNGASAAPVLNRRGELVGMLSEFDCMKLVASSSFHQEQAAMAARVEDLMTREVQTVDRGTSLYSICHRFLESKVRRLPVMDGQRLLGIISRGDILGAISHG